MTIQTGNIRRQEKVPTHVRHPFGSAPEITIDSQQAEPEALEGKAGKGKPKAEAVPPPPEK